MLKDLNPPRVERQFCYKCWRSIKVCLCDSVKIFKSPIDIGILQHPHENKMPVNTARLLQLSMPENSFLIQGCQGICQSAEFQHEIKKYNPQKIAVLYPSPNAKKIEEVKGEIDLVLLIDGTWSQAQKLWFHNQQELGQFQAIAFEPESPSRYRIRKEPSDMHVSSIEAAIITLRGLSGNPSIGQEALDLFELMVDKQLGFMGQNRRHHQARVKNLNLGIREENKLRYLLFNTPIPDRITQIQSANPSQQEIIKAFALNHGVEDVLKEEHLGIQAFASKLKHQQRK